ncbi:MAG: DUF2181 domain-containing protein [Gaiellales bacterium]
MSRRLSAAPQRLHDNADLQLKGRHDFSAPSKPSPTPPPRALLDTAARIKQQHPSRTWDPDAPLAKGRNAHHSNTEQELRDALQSDADYNWLEGDLRVNDAGTLVMAHDADKEDSGLTLDQWLAIGSASERGMKVDVKEDAAIPELLDALEASGIPDGRLMINIGSVPLAQVTEIRNRFPDAWLALNPKASASGYSDAALEQTIQAAQAAGGRVSFPIRWDIASDDVINRLQQHGDVSIWTSQTRGTPDDTDAETVSLRRRGVSGVVDLGPPSSFVDKVKQRLLGAWDSTPARGARALMDGIRGSVADAASGAFNLAHRTQDTALDAVKRAPGAVVDAVGGAASATRGFIEDAPLLGRWL